jgi:prophage antirepressor-like protein
MFKLENAVGTISFDGKLLDVYMSLDNPIFKAKDVAAMIDYSEGNTWKMLEMCEADEKLNLPIVVGAQRRIVSFVTESGLYNILAQSRKPIARRWRRVVHNELIRIRKERDMDIIQQFEEWDDEGVYWDEETGMLMQSVTVKVGFPSTYMLELSL